MTVLAHVDWEGPAAGVAYTPANSAVSQFLPANSFVADTTHVATGQGTKAAKITLTAATASARITVTSSPVVYEEIWIWPVAAPTANITLGSFRGATDTVTVADIRLLTDMSVSIRNSGFTKVAGSAVGALKTGQWNKIQVYYNTTTGQAQLRMFWTTPTGNTPDYDSGLVATTAAGNVDLVQFGAITAATWTAWFGDYDLNTTGFLSGSSGGGGSGTVTFRAAAANPTTGTTPNATVVIPSTVVAGDELILQFFGSGAQAWVVTTPTGWTKLPVSQATTVNTYEAYRKTAVAGDIGATLTVVTNNTAGAGQFNRLLHVSAYSGGSVGDCKSTPGVTGVKSTAHTCPTANVVNGNAWTLNGCWDRGTAATTAWTVPANLTKRTEYTAMTAIPKVSGVTATDDVVGVGSQGGNTITGTLSTDAWIASTIVIEPTGTVTPLTVFVGPDVHSEPWKPVTIVPTVTGGTPDSWTWAQVAAQATTPAPDKSNLDPIDVTVGATVDANGTIHFNAPPDTRWVDRSLQATAHKAGVPDASDTMVLSIYPATRWFVQADGRITPIRYMKVT